MTHTENLFSLALETTNTGVFEVDLQTQRATWSPACYRISGRTEPFADLEDFLASIHPGDREAIRRHWHECVEGSGTCSSEYRLVRPDGEVRWVESEGRVVEQGGRRCLVGTVRDVTEREVSARALRASEDRYKRLLERSPDPVWVSRDQKIVFVNAAALRLLGARSQDQLLGKSPYEFMHPDDHAMVRQRAAQARAGEFVPVREEKVVTLDGRVVEVEVTVLAYREDPSNGLLVILRDITERRRLQESEEKFRQVIENIPGVFWMEDARTHEVLYLGPGFRELTKRPPPSLEDTLEVWLGSIHPEDLPRVQRERRRQAQSGVFEAEYRILRPDGEERWVRDRGFPVYDGQGTVYAVAGVADDITERRQLEQQLRQAQKMEAVGMLAGGIAHDFNNILTVVIGNATLLDEELPAGALQEQARQILEASQKASQLTRQLLAFSSKQVLRPARLDLNEVVTQMGSMLDRVLGERVELSIECGDGLPAVYADHGALDQVVLNLAVNARDAMPGGGSLSLATGVVTIGETLPHPDARPGVHVYLEVEDSGVGIAPENLGRLFEPFFTTKGPGRGTGLGLATVYGIVKQHRGWIAVESQVGRGTRFRVHLPASERRPAAALPAPAGGGRETVMVVDDEPTVLKLVARSLGRDGYRVVTADSPTRALELWTPKVDLVICDVTLGEGLSGPELLQLLKLRGATSQVLFTSGYPPDNLSLNGWGFLQKPFTPTELVEKVRGALA